ncbi:DUF342 domain-containing protein [Desulfonatronovibrio magnus]|uniref:DUF342 domain-containing protein n=1 Tax=Desulfonatronovibrio magnus TaxID=698827 RepID=UPI0005EB7F92|nr:FapA family protein [Desulfonatronovibrio magnus]
MNKATIELVVTQDGLIIKVHKYTPPSGKGSPLTEKQILAQLKQIGIRMDINHDLIHAVVAKAVSGSDITGMAVLKGVAPCMKGAEYFKLKGNPDLPVFKGMVIGSIEKHKEDIPGIDVFNQKVMPGDSQQPTAVKIGSGCVLNQKTNNVLARGYGQVLSHDHSVRVKPLFRISPDKTRITSVLFHSDFYNKKITVERIVESLTAMQLGETIVLKTIEEGLRRAAKNKSPQIAVVAKGRPPLNGRDGYFEPSDAIKPPEIDESDVNIKVDYRERGIFRTVATNTELGKIYPPEEGTDGYDVFGKLQEAKTGKEAKLKPGKNVSMAPSGLLSSTMSGLVVFEKNTISVLDFMTINGDVDYSTGNIRLESGSVEITGSIKEGFVVKAPEHILVHENIEDARVSAGGKVEVNFGVVMKGSGKIQAGGAFRCKFAENAMIQIGEDLNFSSNLNNCRIHCKGAVLAPEKGIIMGGEIKAEKYIEVNQIGSEYGIKTDIYVGPAKKNIEKLANEKAELTKHHQEIKNILMKNAMENKSGKLTAEQKKKTKELMETYAKIQERIKKMDKIIREKGISPEDARKHYVKVKQTAYPGTNIYFQGKSLKLVEAVHGAKFSYDPAKDSIIWG